MHPSLLPFSSFTLERQLWTRLGSFHNQDKVYCLKALSIKGSTCFLYGEMDSFPKAAMAEYHRQVLGEQQKFSQCVGGWVGGVSTVETFARVLLMPW